MSHIACLVSVGQDRASFTWSQGPASFEPYQLDGQVFSEFQEIAHEARKRLSDLVTDYLYSPENVPKASYALAKTGHELYLQIFDPGAEQLAQAKRVRIWLESLRDQKAVESLEVVLEKPWSLPWNVLYDQEPDEEAFLSAADDTSRWEPFWGIRYNLAGGRKVDPLRRMPWMEAPHVLMVVDARIRGGLPEDHQQRLNDFVQSHELTMVGTKSELAAEIKTRRPDIIYWLSHATPSALVLGDEEITPRQLRKLFRGDRDYQLGGFVFLNACQTAEMGETGSFFDALQSVGFSGMVGTEHQTVDTFANLLGIDFLEAFLDEGKPVGEILHGLRAQVPLGLVYGTYCPPDIMIQPPPEALGKSVRIRQMDYLAGTPLGAGDVAAVDLPPLPDDPYRSLAYYDRQDRALFAGRDDDVERFATLLDDADTRILVLHGESGVGKSSF